MKEKIVLRFCTVGIPSDAFLFSVPSSGLSTAFSSTFLAFPSFTDINVLILPALNFVKFLAIRSALG
jgi:hypothetical protein